MSQFANLEKYNLNQHGDSREQDWWCLLADDFPEYEVFWRRYIVILTSRIDPKILRGDPRWIYFRDSVPELYAKMAMSHYSVFYFLARATRLIQSPRPIFPEDAFYLLDACVDNLKWFFGWTREIIRDLGSEVSFLPSQFPGKDAPKVVHEIQEYRDVMLHNPVLARKIGPGIELIPKRGCLKEVQHSWRQAAGLKEGDWVDSRSLLSGLRASLLSFMCEQWSRIIETLDEKRKTEKFIRILGLHRFLPIPEPDQPSTVQPIAASGQQPMEGNEPFLSEAPSGSFPLDGENWCSEENSTRKAK